MYCIPSLFPVLFTEKLNKGETDETDAAEINERNFVNLELTHRISMKCATPEREKEVREHLKTVLPDEQEQVWHRKVTTKNMFHKEPT